MLLKTTKTLFKTTRLTRLSNDHVCAIFDVAGFRPGRRGPFVSAKGPKTMLAVAWPFGSLTRFANTSGAQTRGAWPESSRRAQTVRAFSPVSAALLGHTTRPAETAETMHHLTLED
ncbi:MAG TPA: hypothetical protein DD706_04635 [Nitrospiraceae bacterium]|nr:hypothetical protein [Nitrospiraceae bacterium]